MLQSMGLQRLSNKANGEENLGGRDGRTERMLSELLKLWSLAGAG